MEKIKKELIKNLENTFCRLKKSKIAGVGIFAIRDVPEGTNPFYGVQKHRWYDFAPMEFDNIDKNTLKMIHDFFAMDDNGCFSLPDCGLNGMDISFFLNTSKNPNVKTIDDGTNFIAIRKIKKGEELTVSYANYDERYSKNQLMHWPLVYFTV